MITCDMQGGLGNMMFQVAAAYALAKRHNGASYFDLSGTIKCITKHFDDLSQYKSNVFSRLNDFPLQDHVNHYTEPHFHYSSIPFQEDLFIHGYFQSPKYFGDCKEDIQQLFEPTQWVIKYLQSKYSYILNSPTVSLHVRRGDYLNLQHVHPTQSREYYVNALQYFDENLKVIVFSDDIEFCKSLDLNREVIFIEEEKDFVDLYLMSMCDNNIICNSTFSWWGAYLNTNPHKRIVAPRNWFGPAVNHNTSDLYCEDWITI